MAPCAQSSSPLKAAASASLSYCVRVNPSFLYLNCFFLSVSFSFLVSPSVHSHLPPRSFTDGSHSKGTRAHTHRELI